MQGTRARAVALALAALCPAAPAAASAAAKKKPPKTVKLQLLGINDFHGNLEPIATGSSSTADGVPAGGAEYLATRVRRDERGVRNSLVVSAGDNIGASPLTSGLFHDEPTIEAMNKIGLDISSVGNHEFDEGQKELERMQNGGCGPVHSCAAHRFRGAKFRFLAANVVDKRTGKPMFPAYAIRRFQGVKVGFIGMTLEGTPLIVTPAGIKHVKFLDEARTANKYAKVLRRKGVHTIVVLLHEGGQQNPLSSPVNDCTGFTGPVVDIVNRTTKKVDLFMTGHTHQPYNCVIDGRPVTSAFSFGRVVTDVKMKLSGRTGRPKSIAVDNQIVTRTVPKAPAITRLIRRYVKLAAPIANAVIGHINGGATNDTDADGESQAGDLIADSQLAATDDEQGAVAAFMNIGGVRADFPAGDVTYAAAFAVQPFGNNLTTLDLTGAQLWTLLQQQWCNQTPPGRVLQPSAGVSYTYDRSVAASLLNQPCGSSNPVTSFSIDGAAVPDDGSKTFRITVNSFLADGGDGFAVLPAGRHRVGGKVDIDALSDYLKAHDPIDPPALNRINP